MFGKIQTATKEVPELKKTTIKKPSPIELFFFYFYNANAKNLTKKI